MHPPLKKDHQKEKNKEKILLLTVEQDAMQINHNLVNVKENSKATWLTNFHMGPYWPMSYHSLVFTPMSTITILLLCHLQSKMLYYLIMIRYNSHMQDKGLHKIK